MYALLEGIRIVRRSIFRKFRKAYAGKAALVCQTIVRECFNGTYYRTSTGHFSGFYIRDFAWVVDALLKLGHRAEVESTLTWVMEQYARQTITTTLTPKGKAVDIHTIGPDSLAMLLYCLKAAKCKRLVRLHKKFIEKEARRYFFECFDSNLGLVRRHNYFSSMKDAYIRDSSCYDNCMIAIASECLDYFQLKNPWKGYDMERAIAKNFWRGKYFCDDLSNDKISGDANIVPLFFGLFSEKRKQILAALDSAGLTQPLPLRYTLSGDKKQELLRVRYFAPNYEGDTIWMHMGMMYLRVLETEDEHKAKKVRQSLGKMIESYQTFPEVLTKEGKPYSSWAYYCDEGMIWAANYLR